MPMKLSADLKAIIGKDQSSRAQCVKELWAYPKKNNLQGPENKQFFTPDKKRAKDFGTEKIHALNSSYSENHLNDTLNIFYNQFYYTNSRWPKEED